MIGADEARDLVAVWRPRFVEPADFEQSWSRYFETATVPERSRLEAWLEQDRQKGEARSAGVVREPLLPVAQNFELNGCRHCGGNRWVRVNVPVGHAKFGKAYRCPDCNGGRRSDIA